MRVNPYQSCSFVFRVSHKGLCLCGLRVTKSQFSPKTDVCLILNRPLYPFIVFSSYELLFYSFTASRKSASELFLRKSKEGEYANGRSYWGVLYQQQDVGRKLALTVL